MRKIALGLVALSLCAAPALAQAPLNFTDVDTDASGELSLAELQTVWPTLTADEFNAADLDANGSLNADELGALQPSSLGVSAPADNGATAPDASADPGASLSDLPEDD